MTVLRTSLRSFYAHKARMVLSGVAIVLSVAFVCGTLIFSDTLNSTFERFFGATTSDVTVEVEEEEHAQQTGVPESFPADVVERVAAVDGVAEAFGAVESTGLTVVDADNESLEWDGGGPTTGGDWGPVSQRLMELVEGREPAAGDEVLVDADTADNADVAVGDALTVVTASGSHPVTVVGVAEFQGSNPGVAYVFFEETAARTVLLGAEDRVSRVAVDAADGVGDAELKARIADELGGGFEVKTREENREEAMAEVGFLDMLRYAMLGFAGIAVLVGIFLIVNTFSMLVAQRTREIGLMRAIGSSRRQVNRSVLIEALLLGVVCSALGVGVGIGLAMLLLRGMESLGMNLADASLTVTATTPVAGMAVGVLATVVAAWLPARRAGRVSPMAALRDAGTPGDARAGRIRTAVGLVLTGAGAAALLLAATADDGSDGGAFLGLGLLATLVGMVVAAPLLASLAMRVVNGLVLRAFGPVGRLAGRNALRNPRRTGATASALMIGLALVSGLAVVGSSVVASASDQLDRTVGADFIVDSMGQPIVDEAAQLVRDTPGLVHVTDYTSVWATVTTPDGASDDQELVAASPTYADDLRSETVEGELVAAFGPGAMSVPETFARDHGLSVGDAVRVDFVGGGSAEVTIAAVTSEDTVIDQGALYVGFDTARDALGEEMPLNVAMFARAEDGQEAAAYAALKERLDQFPQYDVANQADYKQRMEEEIGGLLNLIYALLALAILVAFLGVVNTLALSVIERTREIGMMRAIGLSRSQLRRMVRLESVVIALLGALLGLGLGMAWGLTAQRLLELGGFRVLEIPWPTLGTVFVGSAVVGLLAALLPAFRAGRMNVLRAIATE
ncbi:FtsX-like permease family protein [Streptomyces sp. 3MP-14]|uniref:FtsX-like permease family protein n=1 Tax=Streptomyces mimosae TaxID=2586635 RepID=A0A5N5ZRF7_9ACTN|nr:MULTISPECIES: ABC transporter permease [Streptomyces]KAB8158855.1 FtsX-like permease family protein [Streptomyces mimosae]KAB8172757.1 FtsX-like permease family protein [Streptomyces sp. 3MP-14]